MKRVFSILLTLMLLGNMSGFSKTNGKTKTIYIKPISVFSDGTVVKTSYNDASEELSVEMEEAVNEEKDDCWIEVVICKDGMEVEYASFNPFTRQLQFNLSDYGAGTYEIYTVAETEAKLIGIFELKNE